MCTLAAASFAVQTVQAVSSYVGQGQTYSRNVAAANGAQKTAEAGLLAQQQQTNAQATDQMTARAKQAMKDAGTLGAIFADSGLSGNTQDRLQSEVAGNAAADEATIERNRQASINQSVLQEDAIRARAQSQINSVARPSLLGTGLQIAAAGVNYASATSPRGAPST